MKKNIIRLLIGLVLATMFNHASAQYYPNGYYPPAYDNQSNYNWAYYPAAPYQPHYYQKARPAYNAPAYGWQAPYQSQVQPTEQNQPENQKPETINQTINQQKTKSEKPVDKKQLAKRQNISVKTSNSDKGTDKKQKLIKLLLPYIQAENESIVKRRQWLQQVINAVNNGVSLSSKQQNQLEKLMHSYRIKQKDILKKSVQNELLSKLDIIPASLTLAQAANESAWGTSRFAREANNFFGIWTYDASKGLKPKKRDTNKKHFVRKFANAGEAVQYYMHMLNSHPAYKALRVIRQQQRADNQAISGYELAQGLEKYSAKGDLYISLIQQLIAQNQWAMLDEVNQNV